MSAKYLSMLLVVAAIAGCTTQATVHKVRGQETLEVNCSGLGSSWEKCYKKAQKSCRPNGYHVLGKSSDVAEDPADGFLGWSPGMYSRTMIIRCESAS
jgi:hypothetical protein